MPSQQVESLATISVEEEPEISCPAQEFTTLPPGLVVEPCISEVATAPSVPVSVPVRRGPPSFLAWLVLLIAVCACSSGGLWFAALPSTPAATRASWRLGATAALQAPFFLAQWRAASPSLRLRTRSEARVLALAGASLALHFVAWSASVARTSLANSLLFVSTTPLLIVAWALVARSASYVLRKTWRGGAWAARWVPEQPTFLEIVGTAAGVAAAALLDLALIEQQLGVGAPAAAPPDASAAAAGAPVPPSLTGDALALLGAACMVVYLSAGARLRAWMPLFLYAFPVTLVAYLCAAAAAVLFEGALAGDVLGAGGLLGCLGSPARFGLTLGAGAVSGILGHTGANYALAEISPLVVSVLLLFDPVLGSAMGWLAGFQLPPDAWTLAFGLLLVACAAVVVIGDAQYEYSSRAWAAVTCAATPPLVASAAAAAPAAAVGSGSRGDDGSASSGDVPLSAATPAVDARLFESLNKQPLTATA